MRFEKIISKWIDSLLSESEVIAIDGKTLRGTKKKGGDYYHLLSAFVNKFGITLYQTPVNTKTNEIIGVIELLKGISIKGKIFTMDALLTQREIAKEIIKGKGDYVMVAKGNQEYLREDIELLINYDNNLGNSQSYIENDKSHGRIETIKITITEAKDIIDFYGVNQVFMIEHWIKQSNKDKEKYERVYGLTSLSKEKYTSKDILKIVREN